MNYSIWTHFTMLDSCKLMFSAVVIYMIYVKSKMQNKGRMKFVQKCIQKNKKGRKKKKEICTVMKQSSMGERNYLSSYFTYVSVQRGSIMWMNISEKCLKY